MHQLLLLISWCWYNFRLVPNFINKRCHIIQLSLKIINTHTVSDKYFSWNKSIICWCITFCLSGRLQTFWFFVIKSSSWVNHRWFTTWYYTSFHRCTITVHKHTVKLLVQNLSGICLTISISLWITSMILSILINTQFVFYLFLVFIFINPTYGLIINRWVIIPIGNLTLCHPISR